MEYNKKEELFDKINGLLISNPTLKETWINMGVTEAYKRTHKFFNNELVPEVPQFVADWYENSKMVLDYAIWDVIHSNAKVEHISYLARGMWDTLKEINED